MIPNVGGIPSQLGKIMVKLRFLQPIFPDLQTTMYYPFYPGREDFLAFVPANPKSMNPL
jgi:hypothetical protein